MSSDDAAAAASARPTVFLSYATQDRAAARALLETLSAFGLEVWLDESELGGGEAWDQKIRKQIRECQYFMPLISAQTEARVEGYFRREWRLAVERTLDMADDHLFLLPITIDATDQAKARVPEKFLAVQWLKVPGGQSTPALEALCRRLAAGPAAVAAPARPKGQRDAAQGTWAQDGAGGTWVQTPAGASRTPPKPPPEYPGFPVKSPGQHPPYAIALAVWFGRTLQAAFLRLPRWARIVAYVWVGIALLHGIGRDDTGDEPEVKPVSTEKLKTIAQEYQGTSNKADIAKLGMQIARELADEAGSNTSQRAALLAVPFQAPQDNAAAARLADSAFAMVYGRLALARHGHVGLSDAALASNTLEAALERGRTQHSRYVLFGAIEDAAAKPLLDIKLASVEDGSVLWTKSYPLAGADATSIATEVETKVPALGD